MADEHEQSREPLSRDGLCVAVVGAGPAGFYAALELLGDPSTDIHVDMFDRLPAPYGLVRYGVAPDHPKIKRVARVFERGANQAAGRYRFFGNVELGEDVTLEELRARYNAVIVAIGAQSDRRLGIPGEDLPGVYAARKFVAWYNGHPDFVDETFDLTSGRAVVVGIGNVAIDVARILTRTLEELAVTDIYSGAYGTLAESNVREVALLARRGPLQAACTPAELRELTRMQGADLLVGEDDLAVDPVSQAQLDAGLIDAQRVKNVELMQSDAIHERHDPERKTIRIRFRVSPVEILGDERVEGVRIEHNRLVQRPDGYVAVEPAGKTETIRCGAVFRSIGYRVSSVPGVPYDEARALIPNDRGQVTDVDGTPEHGLFVAGWAKRGPTGVIGTNKPDAAETVEQVIAAHRAGTLPERAGDDVARLLESRRVSFVNFVDWQLLDKLEIRAGKVQGRPRRKLTSVEAMLDAIKRSGG